MTNPATVSVGDAVTAGQVIGLSDSTGGVAPHLHFEVLKNGVYIDPELIFNEQVTTTIAMAIDYRIQEGTEQEVNLVLGRDISPDDLVDYTTIVELIGVLPGEHQIQFVAIKPNRSLEVLAEVPLTITGPFAGIRGHEISYKDTKVTFPDGDYDAEKEITEVTFSLVAVGEDRLEGQGHVSYIQNNESFNPQSRCPLTSSIASVEWDVFYEGTFTVLPDGSMSVYFEGTPERGPDYVFSQSAPGCEEKTFTQMLTGLSTPSFSPTLVDGEYYERQDRELGEGYTGEDFHEILVEFSSDE